MVGVQVDMILKDVDVLNVVGFRKGDFKHPIFEFCDDVFDVDVFAKCEFLLELEWAVSVIANEKGFVLVFDFKVFFSEAWSIDVEHPAVLGRVELVVCWARGLESF